MTRAELEVLREDVAAGLNNLALLRIDAELAKPEAREWSVVWPSGYRDMYATRQHALDHLAHYDPPPLIVIESRTPAGPWERAE